MSDVKKHPLFISNPTNIRYLTGFVGVDKRDAYLLITKDQKILFTSSLYLEMAKKLKDITVIEISKEKPIEKILAKITDTVRFEEKDLTVSEFNTLKKTIKTLIPTKNEIEKLRMIKRADEIVNIKKACELTKKCLELLRLKIGVTESQIAWEIEKYFRERGADTAFSPIVAFNNHASQPHYKTGDERLTNNSLVLLDFGARINGYCADMTRVVFIGTPKPEWTKAYNTVLAAQKKAFDLLKSGERSGKKLDASAKKIISDAGLPPYSHSLGHNVGLDIHEAPRLTIKKNATLKPGMVFSVEPGVYVEGRYGIRIEDLVLLKKEGFEILT